MFTIRRLSLALFVTAVAVTTASAQSTATARDSAGIRATSLDYIEGWYQGNAERMRRAVHPELAKRILGRRGGTPQLQHQGAQQLIDGTAAGYGRSTPPAQQRTDVRILDVYENAASVRVDAGAWVDDLHLVREAPDRGVIVNVLWEMRPRPQ